MAYLMIRYHARYYQADSTSIKVDESLRHTLPRTIFWLLLIQAIFKSKENSSPLDAILKLHPGKVPPNFAGKYSPDGTSTATSQSHHSSISRKTVVRNMDSEETAVQSNLARLRRDR